ncbi:MAG TPA: pyridoxamine 5'-phosphate oxidase, partial [Candidatus Acidoferrum sp.]|nr:pyridoxamine 5'-phosphate oxidase [Candidatus Acidoferrum sp.]
YVGVSLEEAAAGAEPLALFERWFQEALEAEPYADAMTLATAGPGGQPSARIVLLKGFGPDGFVFYTSYESRKAEELARNPAAALLFFWPGLHRQVRIEGPVAPVEAAASDAYFASRPRASNLSAMASAQSRVAESRAALEREVEAVTAAWDGRELERPPHWGGYCLAPHALEFWQGREDRLHDRLCYRRAGQGWTCERLSP